MTQPSKPAAKKAAAKKAPAKKAAAKKTTAPEKPAVRRPPRATKKQAAAEADRPVRGPLSSSEDPQVDVSASPVPSKPSSAIMDFKRSAPTYDLTILDSMIDGGRGDLTVHRDAIVTAIEEADIRGNLGGKFKDQFVESRILNMPLLNEAINNGQTTARELRGQLWKTIKSLPAT